MKPKDQREAFRDIERREFERYVFEVVRQSAAEEERLYRETEGKELTVLVRSVELVREYPETAIQFRTFDRTRGIEQRSQYPIWDEDYMTADGEMKGAGYIAGEMLIMARGG